MKLTRKLGPGLKTHSQTHSSENGRLEEIHVRLGTLTSLEGDLVANFVVFKLHELIVQVTAAMKISEDFKCLILSIVILSENYADQPGSPRQD